MILTNDPSLSIASQRIESDLEAFLAAGGQIESVPVGAMAEMGWTAKERANRPIRTKASIAAEVAEREARKLARQSVPAPRAKERRPPKLPKVRTANGPRQASPGTLQREALEAITEPMSARELADLKGWDVNVANQRLALLRKQGLAISTGVRPYMRWVRKEANE